jgi:hypothetical protein
MKVYRVVWWLFCGLVGALGVVVASTWSLTSIILLIVLAALTGGVVAMVILEKPDKADLSPRHRRRVVTTSAILSAGGTVAFIGLGTLLGAPTAVLLAAIVVGTSPPVARYCLRRLGERGHLAGATPLPGRPDPAERSSGSGVASVPQEEPDQTPSPPVAADLLDDEALCLAWRTSFSALQRAGTPEQRLRIVDERRAYLDEIEHRAARGLAAWLASGPRAAGDPSRFVLGDGAAGRAPIDWDTLLHDTDK